MLPELLMVLRRDWKGTSLGGGGFVFADGCRLCALLELELLPALPAATVAYDARR